MLLLLDFSFSFRVLSIRRSDLDMQKRKILVEVEVTRPEWATPEVLNTLRRDGKTLQEIATMAGISRERVRQIIKRYNETKA